MSNDGDLKALYPFLHGQPQAPAKLDAATYPVLAARSSGHPVTYYSAFEPNLFQSIIAKYAQTHQAHSPRSSPDAR